MKLFVFLIFSILFYLNLVIGIQIIEFEGYVNKYTGAPEKSDGESCLIKDIRFLIIDEDIDESIDVVEVTPSTVIAGYIKDFGDARIYKFQSAPLPLGTNTFIISLNLTNGEIGPTHSFEFSCAADYSNAIVKLTNPQLRKNGESYCAPFYVEGISFKIEFLSIRFQNIDYSVKSNGYNSFCWTVPVHVVENINIVYYDFEVILGIDIHQVQIISPNFNKLNILSSISTFPPGSTIFTEPAKDITALLMFTSNTVPLSNSPYQYLLANQSGTNYYYPAFPSYGVKGAITYIAPFNDGTVVDQQLTSFYFRHLYNGLMVDLKFDKTLKLTIEQSIPDIFQVSLSMDQQLPLFEVEFTQIGYNFNLYVLKFGGNGVNFEMTVSAPYGLYNGGGTTGTIQYRVSPIRSAGTSKVDDSSFCASFYTGNTGECERIPPINNQIVDTDEPEIRSYEFIHLVNSIYRLIINVVDPSGVALISSPSFITSKTFLDSLTNGDIMNGNYEFLVDVNKDMTLTMGDIYENYHNTFLQDYISINIVTTQVFQYKLPDIVLQTFTLSSFEVVFFEWNDLNLTATGDSYNTIIIKVSYGVSVDKQLQLELLDPISFDQESKVSKSKWPIIWNSALSIYAGKFVLPKNTIFGYIPYQIRVSPTQVISSSELLELIGVQSQLNVVDSYFDNAGPIVDTIDKALGYSGSDFESTLIGWLLHITDNVGFSNGYVKVMGSIDNSIYHFNFTTGNLTSYGNIEILIETIKPCYSQDYVIVYASFVDVNKVESVYEMYTDNPKPSRNPFRILLDDSSALRVSFVCPAFIVGDTTPPVLTQFIASKSTMNVLGQDRLLEFNFEVEDLESGIKKDQIPIVYITSNRMDIIECVAQTVVEIVQGKKYAYVCTIEIPYGFGYPSNLAFSIYGLINNYGLYRGYTSVEIINAFPNQYLITTTDGLFGLSPQIVSHSPITTQGGRLVLFGSSLQSIQLSAQIKFLDDGFVTLNFTITSVTPTSLTIDSIPVAGGKPYIVTLYYYGTNSFTYTVIPIYFNPEIPMPTNSPTSTPTTSPTGTPTASPTSRCLGNPECGGNGYCNVDKYCVCYSPWVGIDCTSKVIIVPKPNINNTNPSTEIPIVNGSDNEQTSNYLFKSLISIVSLREINFNGQEVIKTIEFDKWILTELNDKKNQYFTNFTAGKDIFGNEVVTNVTVELEWFYESTTIQFASSNLTMNPSTIKYTIKITKYPFTSNLNQLQLIMSAQFESSNSQVCSLNKFGELSSQGDNYLKIQIEDHSLYGRFIKRAIIDSKVLTVSNQLLDSSYNEITNTGEPKVNSFIGITIPNYQRLIIVDPDFSVLLDSNSASDNDDSVCTGNSSSSKLKPSQIAGIVIGVIAFTAVIVTAIAYHLIKKKKQIAFKNNIENKLNNFK